MYYLCLWESFYLRTAVPLIFLGSYYSSPKQRSLSLANLLLVAAVLAFAWLYVFFARCNYSAILTLSVIMNIITERQVKE